MNYFVTVDDVIIAVNLTKATAIKVADREYEKTQSTLRVGIGWDKTVKSKRVHTCWPMCFFKKNRYWKGFLGRRIAFLGDWIGGKKER